MVKRRFWLAKVQEAWKRRSVVWLAGVRRAGKTTVARGLPGVDYYDCELPDTRRIMEDPEKFLHARRGSHIVLDEVHRLPNPSEMLKIAADHYPTVRILATASSTISASTKFKDTLTGRKADLWLTPLMSADLEDFGHPGLERRMLNGGLPEYHLSRNLTGADFQSWMDNFWAKDILTLFRIRDRESFERFTELLFIQSGGMFEAFGFSRSCGVSRETIRKYLYTLEYAFVAHVIRPFSSRRAVEIVSAPKVYAFDTGFVCNYRGWDRLKPEHLGLLWEHLVLNDIHARTQSRRVLYWRDKLGHEVDFVLRQHGGKLTAIECKWSAEAFDPAGFRHFSRAYPGSRLIVVAHDSKEKQTRNYDGLEVSFTNLAGLQDFLPV